MATRQKVRPLADQQVDALAKVEAWYRQAHGPRAWEWSRSTRGEYVEAVSAAQRKPRAVLEPLTAHPRRSSAASRRHHRKYLAWRLRQIVPDAATVLVIPMWADLETDEVFPQVFLALVRDASGERLVVPEGKTPQIVRLLQAAFVADWSVAQTWRAADGSLTARRPRVPAHMAGRWV